MPSEQLSGIALGAQVVGVPTAPASTPSYPPHFITTLTGAGSGTYTVPALVTKLWIGAWGAGGGGSGGRSSDPGNAVPGGGGGGGGEFRFGLFTVTPGQVINYDIGAAGTGGAVDANGVDGGDTTLDIGLTAAGGKHGINTGVGGAGGHSTSPTGDGGFDGGAGRTTAVDTQGGNGGSSAGFHRAGITNGTTSIAPAVPPYGGGMGGFAGFGTGGTKNGGVANGVGGGGGGGTTRTSAGTGGAGFDGQIVIRWTGN